MRRVLALSILASIVFSGCAGAGKRNISGDARVLFDAGYRKFEQYKWVEADALFTRFLRQYPTSSAASEVYYYRGLSRQRLGRRLEARRDFQAAIGAEGNRKIVAFAKVALANMYYEEGNDGPAIHLYASVLKDPPEGLPLDLVLFRLAVSLQRIGKWAEADKYLRYVLEHHPQSPMAGDAKRRLGARYFTVQVGAYSQVASAQKIAARVRKAGFKPWFAVVLKNGRQLHTVRIGKTATYVGASRLAGRVDKAGFKTLIVP
ncbi:MAG: tetratricopeptide repeat protein [Planctomycetia bacterium]|nr:tetratricopeptide repeat protein [Planctomycetia bacterium]